jgi:hypothetical protein
MILIVCASFEVTDDVCIIHANAMNDMGAENVFESNKYASLYPIHKSAHAFFLYAERKAQELAKSKNYSEEVKIAIVSRSMGNIIPHVLFRNSLVAAQEIREGFVPLNWIWIWTDFLIEKSSYLENYKVLLTFVKGFQTAENNTTESILGTILSLNKDPVLRLGMIWNPDMSLLEFTLRKWGPSGRWWIWLSLSDIIDCGGPLSGSRNFLNYIEKNQRITLPFTGNLDALDDYLWPSSLFAIPKPKSNKKKNKTRSIVFSGTPLEDLEKKPTLADQKVPQQRLVNMKQIEMTPAEALDCMGYEPPKHFQFWNPTGPVCLSCVPYELQNHFIRQFCLTKNKALLCGISLDLVPIRFSSRNAKAFRFRSRLNILTEYLLIKDKERHNFELEFKNDIRDHIKKVCATPGSSLQQEEILSLVMFLQNFGFGRSFNLHTKSKDNDYLLICSSTCDHTSLYSVDCERPPSESKFSCDFCSKPVPTEKENICFDFSGCVMTVPAVISTFPRRKIKRKRNSSTPKIQLAALEMKFHVASRIHNDIFLFPIRKGYKCSNSFKSSCYGSSPGTLILELLTTTIFFHLVSTFISMTDEIKIVHVIRTFLSLAVERSLPIKLELLLEGWEILDEFHKQTIRDLVQFRPDEFLLKGELAKAWINAYGSSGNLSAAYEIFHKCRNYILGTLQAE